jgi:hypothetical protein
MLRTIRDHNDLLDSAYHDAHRLHLSAQRPGYVVDFELLFRYILPEPDHPEWEQELAYLFNHSETTFVVGPGTSAEIERFLTSRGLSLDSGGNIRVEDARKAAHSDDDFHRTQLAVFRLSELLKLPNLRMYASLVVDGEVDQPAFAVLLAALDKRRRRASKAANVADALNWAAVVRLRREIGPLGLAFYPYLLTATRPLLDARQWTDDDAPISRDPTQAIYTEILFEQFDDPRAAMNHTVQMSYKASELERALKVSPGQLDPETHSGEPQWEDVLAGGRVTEEFRTQLRALAEFVGDSVIRETQRIYDIAHLVATRYVQQQGETPDADDEAPGRLFDLILSINAALSAKAPGSAGLAALWSTILEVRPVAEAPVATEQLVERGGSYEYLTVERHHATDRDNADLLVFSWPSLLDASKVLETFSRAYLRHGVSTVTIVVGIPRRILRFEADLPVELAELMTAIRAAHAEDVDATDGGILARAWPGRAAQTRAAALLETVTHSGPVMAELSWLRMSAAPFDLFADVVTRQPRDPLVGLFVRDPDVEHVVDLYTQTAGRYLFRSWLEAAVRAIVSTA